LFSWIDTILKSAEFNLSLFPLVFLFGIISSAGSLACSMPAIGLITGYALSGGKIEDKNLNLFACLGFLAGSVLSLTVAGYLIGFAGRLASEMFSGYIKVIAGLLAVFFGLITLNLQPFKLPVLKIKPGKLPKNILSASIMGLVTGGGIMACSFTCCNPSIPLLLSIGGLQGNQLKSALVMAVFATGFSLPVTLVLLGLSFGKWALRAGRFLPLVNTLAGIILISAGFYLLVA